MAEADISAQGNLSKDAVPPDLQALIEKLEIVRLFVISHPTHRHAADTLRAINDIKVAIVSQHRSDQPSNAAKIPVELDPTIQEDEIHARTDGKEVGRIVNIGPAYQPSYEEQLATVESMMTCYDTPLTQAAGYVRDLLKTIIALQGRQIPRIDDDAMLMALHAADISDAMMKPFAVTRWKDGIDIEEPTNSLAALWQPS